jgi:hypothetical protein
LPLHQELIPRIKKSIQIDHPHQIQLASVRSTYGDFIPIFKLDIPSAILSSLFGLDYRILKIGGIPDSVLSSHFIKLPANIVGKVNQHFHRVHNGNKETNPDGSQYLSLSHSLLSPVIQIMPDYLKINKDHVSEGYF